MTPLPRAQSTPTTPPRAVFVTQPSPMMGGSHRGVVAAVAGVFFAFAFVAASADAAATSNDAVRFTPSVKQRAGAIPCDYKVTDTVLVDAPCAGKCGLDRQYVVNRRVQMWMPGTPQSEKHLFQWKADFFCTPTRALGKGAPAGEGKSQPLACVEMVSPSIEKLCAIAPITVMCGWATTPRLSRAAAAALVAAVPKVSIGSITQCMPEVATI